MYARPVAKPQWTDTRSVAAPPATRTESAQTTRKPSASESTGGIGWDFGRVAVTTTARAVDDVQPSLAIGQVDDPLEREADRVADHILRTPDSGSNAATVPAFVANAPNALPRLSGAPSSPSPSSRARSAPAAVNDALQEHGHALDESTGDFFGARLGMDFGSVRLHSGGAAERSAAAVNARAYTVGRHIVLGADAPAPATIEGRRLLGHELTHVVQQARGGSLLQRQPRDRNAETPGPKVTVSAPDSEPPLPQFVPADLVQDIKRDNETWTLTVNLHTSPESLTRAMFPHVVPPGVTVTMKVGKTDPAMFVITGLTPTGLLVTEPSYAKLFVDRGLVEEAPESDEMKQARYAFMIRHSGHSDANMRNMILALDRVTQRNPELLLAFYRHYADHALTDESRVGDGIDFKEGRDTGGTSDGDTRINKSVLDLTTTFPTDDRLSLLASTLIHEFVHTPHGGGDNWAAGPPKEAKAYGIELFFSERMGDAARASKITDIGWNTQLDKNTGADKIFQDSYRTIKALYVAIDQGGPAGKEARMMAVEFISKNAGDYGPKLKAFIAAHG